MTMDTDTVRRANQEASLLSANTSRYMLIMVDSDHAMANLVQLVKVEAVLRSGCCVLSTLRFSGC